MNTTVPAISVIVPLYNAEKYVEQAIDSVLNQTFKDFNLIVIDDCSTDGSYDLVQSKYGNDARVRLMRNQKNQGAALTRNTGIRAATGKYIALLDADDAYLPNALELLYNAAETHQADVISSIGYLNTTISNVIAGVLVPELDGALVKQATVMVNTGGGMKKLI